jgi:hypothetical protein
MGKIRTFRDDDVLEPLLDKVPERKMGKVIRRALYNYFFYRSKVMLEDEYSIENMEINKEKENIEIEEKINSVKEINFDMFED